MEKPGLSYGRRAATSDELVAGQYADRPHLRPIFDAVVIAVTGLGDVGVQARKTYVCFLTPRRTFAVAPATTKQRVDLGLRLDAVPPHGRLLEARSASGGAIDLRIPLASVGDVDRDGRAPGENGPMVRDTTWNREVRQGETDAERADRNFRDLLQELRITLSGSQILFAFLLVVPFSTEFRRASAFEHALYLATLLVAALSAGLLVAPAVMHRVVFRRHVKDELLRIASVLTLVGQSLFGLALAAAVLLVGDYLYSLAVGAALAAFLGVWFAVLFFLLPLSLQRREHRRDD